MSKKESAADPLARVQRLVDGMAMRLVVGESSDSPGGSPPWLDPLNELVQEATAANWRSLLDAATRLKDELSRLDPGGPEFSEAAQNGFQTLQEVLEARRAAAETRAEAAAELNRDPELVADFILESREHLQAIEQHLLTIEQSPDSGDSIHAIFRAFHTIKGIAGFLGFLDVREVSHETETLLDKVRNGTLGMSPEVIDIILKAADYLNREVSRIESNGAEVGADSGPLVSEIQAVLSGGLRREIDPDLNALTQAVQNPPEPRAAETPTSSTTPAASQPKIAPEIPPDDSRSGPVRGKAESRTNWIKVDMAKLDFLIDMVGEMVIAQSMVRHNPVLTNSKSAELMRSVVQLSGITGEVQKTAMAMRMVPVGSVFQKMARLVRDLCRKSGKRAELVMAGEDTELDRNIVEELADPLMHMVRNAMDHGIEPPEQRVAAGKPATARVELRASHQAGHILIEIADDGRGMSRDAILAKAKEKGIVPEGAVLSDNEVYNLIFEPGFSTAEKISDISGRGVGMDVVKKHIQKLRGRTEIQTAPGKGTTFLLKLPLTLAIIDGLVVGVGSERYIVPIFAVKEMFRPSEGMVSTVEHTREIALVRDRVLPVVRLYERFNAKPKTTNPLESLLIVTESQGTEYCLMVDTLIGKQEVVIKSLGQTLTSVPGVAGGAILGDGRVALILEMNALFHPVAKV